MMRLAFVAFALLITGCASERRFGGYPAVMPEAAGLVRGVSMEADVVQRLGAPTGRGSAILPPAHEPRTLLFYQDIEATDITLERSEQIIKVRVRQRILLVFLLNGRYDGFMWYANEGAAGRK